jgi:hypothetical protein
MASHAEVAETADDPHVPEQGKGARQRAGGRGSEGEGARDLERLAPRRRWWQRIHWDLVVLLVLAIALRGAWLAYARPMPVSDFKHYFATALTLVDGGSFGLGQPSAWRLPAYPAFLALGAWISPSLLLLSALTVALSVVQVGLTYWLAWLTFRRRPAAFTAGLVAAVAPAFVMFAPVLASEHLLAVCVLGALIAAMRADRRIWAMAALSGALLGVGVLTRGEAGAYLPVVMLVVAVTVWKAPALRVPAPATRRALATLGATAVVVVAAAVVVAPWIVRNEIVVGRGAGLSTTGGFNFYLAHSPGAYGWRTPLPLPLQVDDEVVRNKFGWTYGLKYVREHPEDWAPTIQEGTRGLLKPSSYAGFYSTVLYDVTQQRIVARADLDGRVDAIRLAASSSHWLLWAGLGGLLLVPMWRTRMWLAVVGVVAANWVVYAVIFWAQARYRFVVDALACVAVGAVPAAIHAVTSWVSGGWGDYDEEPPTPEQIMRELEALGKRAD